MKQILIIDDDKDYLAVLHYMLVREGFAVKAINTPPSFEDVITKYIHNPNLMGLDDWVENHLRKFLRRVFELYDLPEYFPIVLMSNDEYAYFNRNKYREDALPTMPVNVDHFWPVDRYCN
jgi:DNA-binding NtrC family response regulator